jgi:hypothetical protein
MQRTSLRNPPSTKYQRPIERKFFIWRDRSICWGKAWADDHNREERPWRWCCTFCNPPSYGFRCKKGAWQAIINTSMPRHFFVRQDHHHWVAGRYHVQD